jgi:hypothetical protein
MFATQVVRNQSALADRDDTTPWRGAKTQPENTALTCNHLVAYYRRHG